MRNIWRSVRHKVRALQKVIARSESLQARTIVCGGLLFAMLMVGLCALSLMESRDDTVKHTYESISSVALIAERDIDRNIELYALSLQGAIEGLNEPEVQSMSPHMKRMVLFDRAATAEYLGSMLVLDEKGDVILDSANDIPRTGNFSDRDYFIVHREKPNLGLYISAPFISRLRDGSPSIGLSRRINKPDGSFGGVVVIAMKLDYFRDLFSGLSLGKHGAITLLNTNGMLIMRQPYAPALIGRIFQKTVIYDHLSSADAGTFYTTPEVDGIPRFYAFRRLPSVPLTVIVGAAARDVYANWEDRAATIGFLMLLFSLGFVLLSVLLSKQLRRRMRAEAELQLLARTDGLTGLNNRRTLGEILDGEWRRAQRTRTVFSLLFVDIDHFKHYNDTYGHQAGDKALAAVAQCISGQIRQSWDSAARYGGEEFVVVLPDTSEQAAAVVAAKLLDAIRQLGIQHANSKFGTVTASIGTASWDPVRHSSVSAVIKAADDALYRAKASGRNNATSARQNSSEDQAATV